MKLVVAFLLVAMAILSYYVGMQNQALHEKIDRLSKEIAAIPAPLSNNTINSNASTPAPLISDSTKSDTTSHIQLPSIPEYRLAYSKEVRVDLFELGSKVIPLGRHAACYLTGSNQSGDPDSFCFITSAKKDARWQLQISNAICSARCIDLIISDQSN